MTWLLTMPGRRWTRADDKRLLWLLGSVDIVRIAEELGRTPYAVEHRVKQLGYDKRRDTISIREAVRRTGYDESTIHLAAKELGIYINYKVRVSYSKKQSHHRPTRDRALTEDQFDRIVDWLSKRPGWRVYSSKGCRSTQGEWGTGNKPAACVSCGTTSRPHVARGMCSPCSRRYYHHKKRNSDSAEACRCDEAAQEERY